MTSQETVGAVTAEYACEVYVRAYARRRKETNERPFKAPLQSALLALLYSRVGAGEGSKATKQGYLGGLDAVSREILERQRQHALETDVTGYAWASAYGALPVPAPPLPHLEFVLASGSSSGAVSGLIGVAWRALFLAAAFPYFSWEHRRRATVELDRRLAYLDERVVDGQSGAQLKLHQVAQLVYVTAEVAERVNDYALANAAAELFATRAGQIDEAGFSGDEGPLPTAQIAQLALAAHSLGADDARDRAVGFLLSQCVSRDARLLLRQPNVEGPLELSPWVPLALAASAAPRPRLLPSRPR